MEGKANEKLWEEVLEYIEAVYDTEFLKESVYQCRWGRMAQGRERIQPEQ